MGDKTRGLYNRYHVERIDKASKHDGCDYFVLDMDCDKHAIAALEAYAQSCESEYELLARDLRKRALLMRWNMSQAAPRP